MNESNQSASVHLPEKVPTEEIIYYWPHTAETVAISKRENSGVISVSTVLGCGLVTAFIAQHVIADVLSGHASAGYIAGAVFVTLIMSPLWFMASKKIAFDRLRIAGSGLHFERTEDKSPSNKTVCYEAIQRVYLQPKEDVLSSVLVIETTEKFGPPVSRKIPLSKIRSGDQWRRLVAALRYRCVCPVDLDETLLDGHEIGMQHDPSYTKLWYEALTAAPKRARLLPLSQGAELQDGAYSIEMQIGSGGQGTAYLATVHAPGSGVDSKNIDASANKVVLKEYILPVYVDMKVRRHALETFDHESSMLCSLKHPSIVSMLDSFVEDHRAYLVLEYIKGCSVRDGILAEDPLPDSTCIPMGMVMCDILQYLHSQSPPIVHQDFTPDNLLVTEDGNLKLIDFMVAKHQSVETSTSTVVGKHHYMPPEQFRGKSTTQSDIYALGATLYFMLTGQDPEPMSQLHVSSSLDSVIARATALDTAQRYASAQEVKTDLQQLLEVKALT